ncbi:hypothetical protein EDB19DRAFT_1945200 [Suillus lakei]|nr:hypothetical protein EDB19DRAFT_1945200 [Suillus lakei]
MSSQNKHISCGEKFIDTQESLRLHSVCSPAEKYLLEDLLALHTIGSSDPSGSTIISYHPSAQWNRTTAERLKNLVQKVGESVYWQKIFERSKDPSLVLLAILWYALYAWDESLDHLYTHMNWLEINGLSTNDNNLTTELHAIQARLLRCASLLEDFGKSVTSVRNTPNPILESSKFGGGMGVTHGNKKTYPRLADVVGFCTVQQGPAVAEKIMLTQRDSGGRAGRKNARLKYTIDRMGLDAFKAEVESRLGYPLAPARPYAFDRNINDFGWSTGDDGRRHAMLFIENGRIQDEPDRDLNTGLREIAKIHKGTFHLTANQHITVSEISTEDVPKIKRILATYKLDSLNHTGLRLSSSACVAFPTCEPVATTGPNTSVRPQLRLQIPSKTASAGPESCFCRYHLKLRLQVLKAASADTI